MFFVIDFNPQDFQMAGRSRLSCPDDAEVQTVGSRMHRSIAARFFSERGDHREVLAP
jgi:hypothetical protein